MNGHKYIGLFLLSIVIIWALMIINFALSVLLKAEDNKSSIIYELKYKLFGLFKNRNKFGTILSTIYVVILIPGIVLVILIKIVIMIRSLVIHIWEYGNITIKKGN